MNLNGGTLAIGTSIINADYGPSGPVTSIINFNGGRCRQRRISIIEPGFNTNSSIQANVLAGGVIISNTYSLISYVAFSERDGQ